MHTVFCLPLKKVKAFGSALAVNKLFQKTLKRTETIKRALTYWQKVKSIDFSTIVLILESLIFMMAQICVVRSEFFGSAHAQGATILVLRPWMRKEGSLRNSFDIIILTVIQPSYITYFCGTKTMFIRSNQNVDNFNFKKCKSEYPVDRPSYASFLECRIFDAHAPWQRIHFWIFIFLR